jgi:hypothetical protein
VLHQFIKTLYCLHNLLFDATKLRKVERKTKN